MSVYEYELMSTLQLNTLIPQITTNIGTMQCRVVTCVHTQIKGQKTFKLRTPKTTHWTIHLKIDNNNNNNNTVTTTTIQWQ